MNEYYENLLEHNRDEIAILVILDIIIVLASYFC
jgi:hypothetical protein